VSLYAQQEMEIRLGVCGCPEEIYPFKNGSRLLIHFELNGDVDGFLEYGDDADDWITFSGLTPSEARAAIFAWADAKVTSV
jgi:hypothetical protein